MNFGFSFPCGFTGGISKTAFPRFEETQKKPEGFFYLQTSIPKSDISLEGAEFLSSKSLPSTYGE